MAFTLFILVNATLFIRPAEVVPALAGLPIYNVLISTCLMASFPRIIDQLTGRSLLREPDQRMRPRPARRGDPVTPVASELLGSPGGGRRVRQVILYYLLLVSVVDSPARLRRFLWLLVVFTARPDRAGPAPIPRHDRHPLAPVDRGSWRSIRRTGEEYIVLRLCSTGIYHDPNDLCLILLVAMGICLYGLGDRARASSATSGSAARALRLRADQDPFAGRLPRPAGRADGPVSRPLRLAQGDPAGHRSPCRPCSCSSPAGKPTSRPAMTPARTASSSGPAGFALLRQSPLSGSGRTDTQRRSVSSRKIPLSTVSPSWASSAVASSRGFSARPLGPPPARAVADR